MEEEKKKKARAWVYLTLETDDEGMMEYKVRFDGHPFDIYGLLAVGRDTAQKKLEIMNSRRKENGEGGDKLSGGEVERVGQENGDVNKSNAGNDEDTK
jgi:arginyl-tRNA--protein-N-Asp/Glu arginylyltransferase